jgi:hypothetical protein
LGLQNAPKRKVKSPEEYMSGLQRYVRRLGWEGDLCEAGWTCQARSRRFHIADVSEDAPRSIVRQGIEFLFVRSALFANPNGRAQRVVPCSTEALLFTLCRSGLREQLRPSKQECGINYA